MRTPSRRTTTTFSIDEAVANALSKSRGNDSKAVEILISRAATETELRDCLLLEGSNQVIRNHYSRRRKSARTDDSFDTGPRTGPSTGPSTGPKVEPAGGVTSQYDASEEATQSRQEEVASEFWSKYTLYGHMPLRSASIRDLRVSVKQHRAQILGHQRAADFEDRLADLMVAGGVKTNDVKVADFFPSSRQVQQISKQCWKAK